MGRAATASGGAEAARWWLPWLGLCFCAAGAAAAAARGKRWAKQAAGLGARRGGSRKTERDLHLWHWLPKLSPAPLRTEPQLGGNPAEDLRGDHCLPPQVCYRLIPTGCYDGDPTFNSPCLLHFLQALPNCCRLEYPPLASNLAVPCFLHCLPKRSFLGERS